MSRPNCFGSGFNDIEEVCKGTCEYVEECSNSDEYSSKTKADDGIVLRMQEDGSWAIKKEPYCTIEIETEEDYLKLERLLKIIGLDEKACPTCGNLIAENYKYCPHCGWGGNGGENE